MQHLFCGGCSVSTAGVCTLPSRINGWLKLPRRLVSVGDGGLIRVYLSLFIVDLVFGALIQDEFSSTE